MYKITLKSYTLIEITQNPLHENFQQLKKNQIFLPQTLNTAKLYMK